MAALVFSNVVELFVAGKRPDYDDLKTAFHFALSEMQRISESANDLSGSIARIIGAHLAGDSELLRQALAAFVERHCEAIDGVPTAPSAPHLLEDVARQLNAGKELSILELKAALLQSMTELHWANFTINNVRTWFDNVLSAYSESDDLKIKLMIGQIAEAPHRFPGEPIGCIH